MTALHSKVALTGAVLSAFIAGSATFSSAEETNRQYIVLDEPTLDRVTAGAYNATANAVATALSAVSSTSRTDTDTRTRARADRRIASGRGKASTSALNGSGLSAASATATGDDGNGADFGTSDAVASSSGQVSRNKAVTRSKIFDYEGVDIVGVKARAVAFGENRSIATAVSANASGDIVLVIDDMRGHSRAAEREVRTQIAIGIDLSSTVPTERLLRRLPRAVMGIRIPIDTIRAHLNTR